MVPDTGGLTLVLNATEGLLQIGLADAQGRLLFTSSQDAPSRGVEILMPSLDAALRMLERDIKEIARIAVVRGPGSFTGLRLTATTAAALARAVAARQAGLDYMQCLAMQCAPFCAAGFPDTLLWVLVRARRDLVYAQAFGRDTTENAPFRPLTDLAVVSVASGETAARIAEAAARYDASRVLLAGSGARENRETLGPMLAAATSATLTFLNIAIPWPDTLLAAAQEAVYGDADIEPLYVRASDAEVNLPQIARRLGYDPEEAVRRLHTLTHTTPDQSK